MFPSFSKWETSPFHEAFGYLWLAVNGPEAKGGYWIRDGNEGSLTDLVASGNTITGKWVSRSGTSGKVTVEYKGGSGISGSWTNEARKTGGSFLGKLVPGSVKFADAQAAYENSLTNEVLLDMGCGAAGKLGAAGAAVTIWVKDPASGVVASWAGVAGGVGAAVGGGGGGRAGWKLAKSFAPVTVKDFSGMSFMISSSGIQAVIGYTSTTLFVTIPKSSFQVTWKGWDLAFAAEANAWTGLYGKCASGSGSPHFE